MSWVAVAGTIIGAGVSAHGAKKAGDKAAKGSAAEIAFNEETRDLAREDYRPYRDMGYKALNQMGLMTGLGGIPQSSMPKDITDPNSQWEDAWEDSNWSYGVSKKGIEMATNPKGKNLFWGGDRWYKKQKKAGKALKRASAYSGAPSAEPGLAPEMLQWRGGKAGGVFGMANGGVMYNVNELGPESVYTDGGMTRNSNPVTIDNVTGYVEPNIQGRAMGGMMTPDNPSVGGVGSKWGMPPNPTMDRSQPVGPAFEMPTGQPMGGYDSGGINPVVGPNGERLADMNSPAGGGATDPMSPPTPTENAYPFQTDPGYQFRLNEGMRALEGSAAASGGLMSGGFARKAIRYGQDYATAEFSNIYNRISNIAGLGQVGVQGASNAALQTGQNMGRAASEGGVSSAYGTMGTTNALVGGINDLGNIDWGGIFNKDGGGHQIGTIDVASKERSYYPGGG